MLCVAWPGDFRRFASATRPDCGDQANAGRQLHRHQYSELNGGLEKPGHFSTSVPGEKKETAFRSLIISVNAEMVRITGAHLMVMFTNVLQPGLDFHKLPDQGNLDAKLNWDKVYEFLNALRLDILVIACQECRVEFNPVKLLSSPDRLGQLFHQDNKFKAHTWFGTMTKLGRPSKMYIGALVVRDSKHALDRENFFMSTHTSQFLNKGAVMVFVKTKERNIAFAGTHLDATSATTRNGNIDMIMKKLARGHKGQPIENIYVFGDLNYRLQAAPENYTKKCASCLPHDPGASPGTHGKNKWCYEVKYQKGICVDASTRCPSDAPLALEVTPANSANGCAFHHYMQSLFSDHSTKGAQKNSMFENLKWLDSLQHGLQIWEGHGFAPPPPYTANVPPTYKKRYGQGRTANDWYHFQTLVERGSELDPLEPIGPLATEAELWEAILEKDVYDFKTKLKKCEAGMCSDFGWLDRLMYADREEGSVTHIHAHRTLKMHWNLDLGDHSPLYVLMDTDR